MTTNLDSGEQKVDAGTSQVADNSAEVLDKQNSKAQDVDSLVQAVLENSEFADKLSQAVQSQKDRRFSKIEKTQEEQKDRLDRAMELVQEGKSPAEAKNQIDLEDMLADYRGQGVKSADVASEATDTGANLDVGEQLKKYGVDLDSDIGKQVVADLSKKQYVDRNQLNNALMQEMGRLASKPLANAAAATIQGGGTPPPEDLAAEYSEKIKSVPPGDMRALTNIKLEYRKKGLKIA